MVLNVWVSGSIVVKLIASGEAKDDLDVDDDEVFRRLEPIQGSLNLNDLDEVVACVNDGGGGKADPDPEPDPDLELFIEVVKGMVVESTTEALNGLSLDHGESGSGYFRSSGLQFGMQTL
jgi:hypothetical protein